MSSVFIDLIRVEYSESLNKHKKNKVDDVIISIIIKKFKHLIHD